MRVSELKAWLKSVEDEFDGSDPEIGIDVLAGKHIEFWSMNLDGAHFIKKDNCLSLSSSLTLSYSSWSLAKS